MLKFLNHGASSKEAKAYGGSHDVEATEVLLTRLASYGLLCLLSHSIQDHQPRDGITNDELDPPAPWASPHAFFKDPSSETTQLLITLADHTGNQLEAIC